MQSTSMRVKQRDFHVMRGHVADGVEVECESGAVVTIRSSMSGWEIRDISGSVIESVGFDAMAVTRAVLACS